LGLGNALLCAPRHRARGSHCLVRFEILFFNVRHHSATFFQRSLPEGPRSRVTPCTGTLRPLLEVVRTHEIKVAHVKPSISTIKCSRSSENARHIILGRNLTQETRVYNIMDDMAGIGSYVSLCPLHCSLWRSEDLLKRTDVTTSILNGNWNRKEKNCPSRMGERERVDTAASGGGSAPRIRCSTRRGSIQRQRRPLPGTGSS